MKGDPEILDLTLQHTDSEMSDRVRKVIPLRRQSNRQSPAPRVVSHLVKSLKSVLSKPHKTHDGHSNTSEQTGEERRYALGLETLRVGGAVIMHCFQVRDDLLQTGDILWRCRIFPRVDLLPVHPALAVAVSGHVAASCWLGRGGCCVVEAGDGSLRVS